MAAPPLRFLAAPRALPLLWPVPLLAAILLTQRASPIAVLVSLLTLVTLWPASLAAAELFGPRAGVAASLLSAILVGGWLLPVRPVAVTQPFLLEQRFSHPNQAARHVLRPPRDTAEWSAAWGAPPLPEPYLWFLLVRDADAAPRLVVTVNGAEVGVLGRETTGAFGGNGHSTDREWHRLALSRAAVGAATTLEVVLRPDPSAAPQGPVGLLGGYSFRPTAGPHASSFFDGSSWSSSPDRLFDLALPRNRGTRARDLVGAFRYVVELRLIEPETRRVRAIYY